MAKKPRVKLPKKAKAGEMVQVKTLAPHDMETGNRKGKDGKPIPRMILNNFVCKVGGAEVFSANMHPAVAANPYITFFIKAEKSGTYEFSWTDDSGKVTTVSQDMSVG